ncbi:hypothetical protein [Actinomyces wuliandei]|uniref:hypothetical protein n=1 Tax=Actinomyces wuliandei TaxID=2057743 RepID=UPI000FDA9519|nr:hypothetical protein [Actinomyces wuliandei]
MTPSAARAEVLSQAITQVRPLVSPAGLVGRTVSKTVRGALLVPRLAAPPRVLPGGLVAGELLRVLRVPAA